jgi:hypothetical protein
MRIRCLVRIRYNECTVALKAGEDNHRHETLEDERLALRTLDSHVHRPTIPESPWQTGLPAYSTLAIPTSYSCRILIYKRPSGVVFSTGSCRSLCRQHIRFCRENFLSFLLLLRARSAPYFSLLTIFRYRLSRKQPTSQAWGFGHENVQVMAIAIARILDRANRLLEAVRYDTITTCYRRHVVSLEPSWRFIDLQVKTILVMSPMVSYHRPIRCETELRHPTAISKSSFARSMCRRN